MALLSRGFQAYNLRGSRARQVWATSNVIDACVMECYFHDHMAERDLIFLDDLVPHLKEYDAEASESLQVEFIEHLYRTLNAADSPIRNRLLRLTADSPDLLAVIKQEGQV